MATVNGAEGHGPGGVPRAGSLEAEGRELMTLRVSRDSGRSWSKTTRILEGDTCVILSNPLRFPPCECRRCTGSPVSSSALRRAVTKARET